MAVPVPHEFFIDPSRCIGCNACVQACSECDTHRGHSMIQLDYVDAKNSPRTVPIVCMHLSVVEKECLKPRGEDLQRRIGRGIQGQSFAGTAKVSLTVPTGGTAVAPEPAGSN